MTKGLARVDGHDIAARLLFDDPGDRNAWLVGTRRVGATTQDTITAAIARAAAAEADAQRRLRTLIAFAREVVSPPLPLAKVAAAAGRSASGVRIAYDGGDVEHVSSIIATAGTRVSQGWVPIGSDWRGAPAAVEVEPSPAARPNVLVCGVSGQDPAGVAAVIADTAAGHTSAPVTLLDFTRPSGPGRSGVGGLAGVPAAYRASGDLLVAAVLAEQSSAFRAAVNAQDQRRARWWRWRLWVGPYQSRAAAAATFLRLPGPTLTACGEWGAAPRQALLTDAASPEGVPPLLVALT